MWRRKTAIRGDRETCSGEREVRRREKLQAAGKTMKSQGEVRGDCEERSEASEVGRSAAWGRVSGERAKKMASGLLIDARAVNI